MIFDFDDSTVCPMRTPGSETIVVKPELIRLVRRGDSKKWQVHYKLDGIKTWFRRSSDTADVNPKKSVTSLRQLIQHKKH